MKTWKTIFLAVFQTIYFTNYGQEISLKKAGFKILIAEKQLICIHLR
jgi:hypothetical protein